MPPRPARAGPGPTRASSPARRKSYTIHAGLVDDFKGQSYLFAHNAALTLPDGRSGALGRRSVTAEYLHYDADGRIWPIAQTEAGISQPPRAPAGKAPPLPDPGRSDPRVAVQQFAQGYPGAWPGRPALASVANPFEQAPEPVGFNRDGGAARLVQTFTPPADIALGRISLYAGDGHGTGESRTLRLSLRDVEAGAELLGDNGLAIAYRPQGAGLLSFDLAGHPPLMLKAGRRYALVLQGEKGALTIYLRASRGDALAGGEAQLDDQPLRDKQGRPADFAFALYAR